jgi:cell division protein FtsL
MKMNKKLPIVALIFAVGIILAVVITTSAVREAYRNRSIEKEIDALKQQARQINTENGQLSEKIAYLDTSEFQEKIAKEKLNMQKPDENVVVVKPGIEQNPRVAGDQNETAATSEDDTPNFKKWWDTFFKY